MGRKEDSISREELESVKKELDGLAKDSREDIRREMEYKTASVNKRMEDVYKSIGWYVKIPTIIIGVVTVMIALAGTGGYFHIQNTLKVAVEKKVEETAAKLEGDFKDRLEEMARETFGSFEAAMKKSRRVIGKYYRHMDEFDMEISELYLEKSLPGYFFQNIDNWKAILDEFKIEEDYIVDDWIYRGVWNFKNGKYSEAVHDFSQGLETFPDYTEIYAHRGVSYFRNKEFSRAISDFERSVKRLRDVESCWDLATLQIITGNYSEALESVGTANRLDAGDDQECMTFYLGSIADELGGKRVPGLDYEKAFNEKIQIPFKLDWSLEVFEEWLEDTSDLGTKKDSIIEKTRLMKEHLK